MTKHKAYETYIKAQATTKVNPYRKTSFSSAFLGLIQGMILIFTPIFVFIFGVSFIISRFF